MNKLMMTATIFITLTSSALADPVSDFFGGIFGDQSTQQPAKGKSKHGKAVNVGQSDDNWSSGNGHAVSGGNMVASFYGHGERLSRHTASGAVFNPHAYTCAHRSYPFGTVLRVCHRGCVNVTVNDRGPFVRGRHLDLSYGAARAIGMGSTSRVSVERIN